MISMFRYSTMVHLGRRAICAALSVCLSVLPVAPAFAGKVTATSTALSLSAPTISAGSSVNMTASVSPSTATGLVTFKNGTATVGTANIASGVASFTATFATVGTYSIRAVYGGSATFGTSTSAAASLTVSAAKINTQMAWASNPPVSTVQVGDSVDVSALFSTDSGTPAIVGFPFYVSWDGSVKSTANFAPGLDYSIPVGTSLGNHTVTVGYSGNSAYNASSISRVINVTPQTPTTVGFDSTTMSYASGGLNVFRPSNLRVLTSAIPENSFIRFFANGTQFCAQYVINSAAVCSYTPQSTGLVNLTATFDGNGGSGVLAASSTGPLAATVGDDRPNSSLTVVPTNESFATGVSKFNVTLAIPNWSDYSSQQYVTVNVFDGATQLPDATSAVIAGPSTTFPYSATFAAAGNHPLTFKFTGTPQNKPSDTGVVTVSVLPNTLHWAYQYDAMGFLTLSADPDGRLDGWMRNQNNVVSSTSRQGSLNMVHTLNAADQVTNTSTGYMNLETYSFDGLNNLKTTVSADTGTTTVTSNAVGSVLTSTDARGKVKTFTYDGLQRMKSVSYPTGVATVLEYDGGTTPIPNAVGKISKATDESGSTAFTYDSFGHVLTKTQVIGTKTLMTSYGYGASGSSLDKLTSVTYPSGARVNYSYDAVGRMTSVTLNPVNSNGVGTSASVTPVINSFGFNSTTSTDWTSFVWGSGVLYTRSFDANGRLSTYPLGKPTGTGSAAGLERTLTYGDSLLIKGYTNTNNGAVQPAYTQSFGYDDLGRLATATVGSLSYAYGYNANDSRTSETISPTTYTNTISSTSNRLVTDVSASGAATYAFDSSGNVTNDGTATYAYSDRGRMKSASVGANTVSYLYNAFEQRVSKTGPTAVVATGASYFAYDGGGHVIGEYDANLVPVYEVVYVGEKPIAVIKQSRSGTPVAVTTSLSYVYADHLNAPRVVVRNTDHAIQWRWDTAEPYGSSVPNSNPNALGVFTFNLRFPGQVYDSETGNFQNWKRDYKPSTGRYLQSDTVGLRGGLNTYEYVNGNPVNLVDPTGEVAFLLPLLYMIPEGIALLGAYGTSAAVVATATTAAAGAFVLANSAASTSALVGATGNTMSTVMEKGSQTTFSDIGFAATLGAGTGFFIGYNSLAAGSSWAAQASLRAGAGMAGNLAGQGVGMARNGKKLSCQSFDLGSFIGSGAGGYINASLLPTVNGVAMGPVKWTTQSMLKRYEFLLPGGLASTAGKMVGKSQDLTVSFGGTDCDCL